MIGRRVRGGRGSCGRLLPRSALSPPRLADVRPAPRWRVLPSSRAISGSGGVSGYRSSTRRWPYSPTGFKREKLRVHLVLEIEHDAQDARPEARHADRLDMRIVRVHAPRQLRELAVRLDIFEIEHEALRILDQHQLMRDRRRRFENQPRVFLRRPQCAPTRPSPPGPRRRKQQLRRRQQQPLADAPPLQRDSRLRLGGGERGQACVYPPRVPAWSVRVATRALHAAATARHRPAADMPRTRSGHSITQSESGRKYSAKPESSHSSGLPKR